MSCLSFGLTSFALCGHLRESKENVWSHDHLLPHLILLVSPDSVWSVVRPRPTEGFESVGLWSIASQSVGLLDWPGLVDQVDRVLGVSLKRELERKRDYLVDQAYFQFAIVACLMLPPV